jgi:cytochrome c
VKYPLAVLAFSLVALTLSVAGRAQVGATGKDLFEKRCGGCHALDREKEGPRLGGTYGRAAASVSSFQYSEALKKSGIVWKDDTLDRWLAGPDQLVPDNDMAFRVDKPDERRAIIAYLKQSSGK